MKRPYYIPRPEKNDKKWKPGDEPSASGFLEGFLQGFNFNKNQVKEREANAEEDAAQQRAEAEAAREWAEQQRAQGKDPTDLPRDAEAFVGNGSCGESVSAWRTVQPAVLARVGAAAKRGSRAQRILGGNRRKVTECLARDYRCFPAPMRGAH